MEWESAGVRQLRESAAALMARGKVILAGLAELSRATGVSRQVLVNWRSRHKDFPKPLAELSMGAVWDRRVVLRWVARRRG